MAGNRSRNAGNRGERGAKLALLDRDWLVERRQHGEPGDDGTVIDPKGKTWSLEVKNTKAPPFGQWMKAKKWAQEHEKPLLFMWHPKDWGFSAKTWVCFFYEPGRRYVRVWD